MNGDSSLGLFKTSTSRVSSKVVFVIEYSTLIESSDNVCGGTENKGITPNGIGFVTSGTMPLEISSPNTLTDKNKSNGNNFRYNISHSLE